MSDFVGGIILLVVLGWLLAATFADEGFRFSIDGTQHCVGLQPAPCKVRP